MTRYISILRGINVGGNRKILMSDLRNIYVKLGFLNVTTYIQNGMSFLMFIKMRIAMIRKRPFSNQLIETKLKVSATTRNWKTVSRLVEMARFG